MHWFTDYDNIQNIDTFHHQIWKNSVINITTSIIGKIFQDLRGYQATGDGYKSSKILIFIFIYYYFKCLFILERHTEHEWGRGREREGDTESEASSRVWAVSTEPPRGLNPWSMRLWPELKSDAQLTEPPRCPQNTNF